MCHCEQSYREAISYFVKNIQYFKNEIDSSVMLNLFQDRNDHNYKSTIFQRPQFIISVHRKLAENARLQK